MNNESSTLRAQAEQAAATVLDNLGSIAAALQEVQKELGGLPFFVRGFISSEVTRGTGQDIATWSGTILALTETVREAQAALQRSAASGQIDDNDRSVLAQAAQRLHTEQPRLERLAAFMDSAPSKVNAVPTAVLPADRRDEFLGAIQQQNQSLRGALAAMPELARNLHGLSES